MQARENTVKTVGMYKEAMKLFVKVYKGGLRDNGTAAG